VPPPSSAAGPAAGSDRHERRGQPARDAGHDEDELTDEELAAVQQQMAEVRAQVANTPADLVVANHAMGLYELGAIHLSNAPPNLAGAALAIDALGALVDGLAGRLGENEPVLRDALHQIRLAYVQVSAQRS
jgi:hypothetical protein